MGERQYELGQRLAFDRGDQPSVDGHAVVAAG
jgi:hypothetical protein